MNTFHVVWSKEGQLASATVQADGIQPAFEAFKASNPGGGVPTAPTFQTEGRTTHVRNAKGRVLVVMVEGQ